MTQHRPGAEELIERQSSVEDVAANEPARSLEIERTHDLPPQHTLLKSWSIAIHRRNHQVGHLLAVIVPGAAIGEDRLNMLAEQARHVLARRR
jgi:hypothetical protein